MGLDTAALERLRDDMGGEDALREVLESYLQEAPPLLRVLASAAAAGDAAAVRSASHSLKSMSQAIGATDLASACQELEARARAGTLEGCLALAAETERAFLALRPELERAVGGA